MRKTTYDIFSINVCRSNNVQSVVGHLPMEISRITTLILQRDARVQATVTGKHYQRSPPFHGGLLRFIVLTPLQCLVA